MDSNQNQGKQGPHQGSRTSAKVFNKRNNKVLTKISNIHNFMKIGIHPVNTVLVADLALISRLKKNVKQAVKIAETHACQ